MADILAVVLQNALDPLLMLPAIFIGCVWPSWRSALTAAFVWGVVLGVLTAAMTAHELQEPFPAGVDCDAHTRLCGGCGRGPVGSARHCTTAQTGKCNTRSNGEG